MKIKNLVYLFFLLILFSCVTKTEIIDKKSTSQLPENFLIYTNDQAGFKISYPNNWEMIENFGGTTVAFRSPAEDSSDSFKENVNVLGRALQSKNLKLDEFFQANIDTLKKQYPNFNLLSSKNIQLSDGTPAKKIIFNLEFNGVNLKFLQVYSIKNSHGYVISFTSTEESYNKYINDVENILQSFEII